jgi:hypothetical protein
MENNKNKSNSLRLRVQQLLNNTVEEGIREVAPSSSHRTCPIEAMDVSVSKAASTLTTTVASPTKG